MHLFILIKTYSSRLLRVRGSLRWRALLTPNRQSGCELIVKVGGKVGLRLCSPGVRCLLHDNTLSLFLCRVATRDNTLKIFSCSFYWLISLFIVSIIIPHTLISLQRWIFRHICESGCEWETKRGGAEERGSLFSIFTLIKISRFLPREQTTQWKGE